tara:strand:- start:5195 stop:6022 length:828 start_codon:yes stop_codon:yes gene_type:complete
MITEYYGVKDNVCEWKYLNGILDNLSEMSDSYMMHIVSVTPEWDHKNDVELSLDKRNIILALHDEYMTDCIPDEWKNRDDVLVFKSYLMPKQEAKNVFPLPLGFNAKHIKLVNRPIKDRPTDIFFSGHMASEKRRHYMQPVIDFFSVLPVNKHPKMDVNITKGFNMGFSSEEYSRRLHDAKIVICPAGNVSIETFRHYEGLRSGAVVVSPKLPDNEIYKGSYICQVDDWDNDIGPVLMDLISDLDMLQLVKDKQDNDYNTRFSVKAVADYIYSKL